MRKRFEVTSLTETEDAESWSDRDFVLSGEVGPFTQQLALWQGEDTGSFSNQHRVVEAIVARSCWDQVAALNGQRETHGEERPSAHLCTRAHKNDSTLYTPLRLPAWLEPLCAAWRSVGNKLGVYSPRSGTGGCFCGFSGGIMSDGYNGRSELQLPQQSLNTAQMCSMKSEASRIAMAIPYFFSYCWHIPLNQVLKREHLFFLFSFRSAISNDGRVSLLSKQEYSLNLCNTWTIMKCCSTEAEDASEYNNNSTLFFGFWPLMGFFLITYKSIESHAIFFINAHKIFNLLTGCYTTVLTIN